MDVLHKVQCVRLSAGRRALKCVVAEVVLFQFLLLRQWHFTR